MDPEKPHSLGSLATRMACTLIGLLLLYVLSLGMSYYIAMRYPRLWPLQMKIFGPSERFLQATPLVDALEAYVKWWEALPQP